MRGWWWWTCVGLPGASLDVPQIADHRIHLLCRPWAVGWLGLFQAGEPFLDGLQAGEDLRKDAHQPLKRDRIG